MIEFKNTAGKRVDVDPEHVSAVVDRGQDRVGLRLDHPDIIVVQGEYEKVRDQIRAEKALAVHQKARVYT